MSGRRPALGNPLAIHRAAAPDTRASWQHMKVFSYRGLRELFDSHGLVVHDVLGAGYYPLAATVGRMEPRHAAFLTIVAGR